MYIVINMTDVKLIRRRSSYYEWKELLEYLKTKPKIEDILRKIDELYDMKRAYHYNWISLKSRESLEQLIKDEQLE